MADGDGTQARTYDPVNRLLTVTRSGTEIVPAATFSYVYDATGNVTKRTYPDGRFYDYTYDPVGRMSSVRENNVAASLVAYGYDVAGNQTSQSYPAANGYTESRVYDRAGRTTEVKHDRPAASTATTPMPPTSMLQQTNLTGAVGAIDEDPDAPDSDWMAAVSTIADTSVRVGFATPPYALAGAQTVKAHVRKEGGSANPTARIDLFNNGILVSTGPAVTVFDAEIDLPDQF